VKDIEFFQCVNFNVECHMLNCDREVIASLPVKSVTLELCDSSVYDRIVNLAQHARNWRSSAQ
jgi:hypothetical protein